MDFAQKFAGKLGLNMTDGKHRGGPSGGHGGGGIGLPVAISNHEHILHQPGGTYPRLCRLSDGSILLGMTKFDGRHTRILAVYRSTDNCKTFTPWGEVTRSDGDCDNLFLLEVRGGPDGRPKVLGAFRNHDVDKACDRAHTWYRITVCQSHDGGRTWGYLSQAHEKSSVPNGLWEPFMRVGRMGEVQLTFSQELSPCDQDTMLVVSHDGGQTWTPPRPVTGVGEEFRDGMNGISHTWDNGREALVMVFETTRQKTFSIECVISYDDGATWGFRQPVFTPPAGRNAGSPQIATFGNGCLAVVFMSDIDSKKRHWPFNAGIKVVFAGPPVEGRITWHQVQTVNHLPSLWPGVFGLDGHNLMAIFDHGGKVHNRYLSWHA